MKTHANQVAAWGKLLGHCNTYGGSYKPSKASMNSTALNALLEDAQKSIQAVHNAENDLVISINLRNQIFNVLPLLGTRVMAALRATGAPPDHIEDVNRIRKRFRYQSPVTGRGAVLRKGTGGKTDEAVAATNEPIVVERHGNSQLGFNTKLENFAAMIGLLERNWSYQPNETDLTIESLKARLSQMRQSSKAVEEAKLALYYQRQRRDELIFGNTGIYGHAKLVKDYFSSVFGTRSEEYKVIRKIKFVKE